jgi:hypothetical protein
MTTPVQFYCPMHRAVRQLGAGKCPHCGMALVREGSKWGLMRHMASRPLHLVIMVLMFIVMAAVMMTVW